MRILSPALLAAQKAASGIPLLKTVVQNHIRRLPHYVWTSIFTDFIGTFEHDAAGDADHLHRVRVDAGAVKYQQDQGAAETTLATSAAFCAIAAINDTRVIVVYTFGTSILSRESTDQGASFAAAVLVAGGGASVTALSVNYKTTGGDLAVIYVSSNSLKRVRRTAGTYGSVTTWTQTANSINGVSVFYQNDFRIVLTGTETTTLKPTVWQVTLGDGSDLAVDVWGDFFLVLQAEADAQITFQAPFLDLTGLVRLTFVEKFTGTQAYTRCFWTYQHPSHVWSAGNYNWFNPAPLPDTTDQGLALTRRDATIAYLSRPAEVWSAPVTLVQLDMTDDLLEATMEERDGLRQHGRWVFDNSDGQYAGPPAPISLHRDLLIDSGYVVGGVNEFSRPPNHVIVGWQYRRDGARSTFILHTRGVDVWLEAYRPRTSFIVTGVNMLQVINLTTTRAGIDFADTGSSSRASTLDITWTTHPHQTHMAVLLALIPLYADIFVTGASDFIQIFEPKASDLTDYNYTSEAHPIYHSRTKRNARPAFFEALGEGAVGQAYDFPEMESDAPISDRPRDPNTTTGAQADALAAARARKSILEENHGYLIAPPHFGVEIGDVLEYSDLLVSAASIKARVTSLRLNFRRARGGAATFEQRITLGGV